MAGPADVDVLVGEIRGGLLTFRDPDGTRCVESVDHLPALLGGDGRGLPPDVLVRWRDPIGPIDHITSAA